MNKPRIKVLQYMYGSLEYFPWSEWINRRYCERHGYEYLVRRDKPRKNRHVCWHKIPVILDELHDCDYLLFLDADAVFYSHALKIEQEIIPHCDGASMLLAADCGNELNRWNPRSANSGVIFVRNDELSHKILADWNEASEIDEDTRWSWPPEQLAFERIVLPKHRDFIRITKEYYMLQGIYGQYIRHYCTFPDEDRVNAMKVIYVRIAFMK